MAAKVTLTTHLDCTPDEAWKRVKTASLLEHIAAPLISFVPKGGTTFPREWREGEYRAWMLLFGFLPIGWQAIVISLPEPRGEKRFVRDNGYGPLIRRWDHWITIEPEGTGTRYTDEVDIEAGILTPIVAGFARIFYAHRQRRWRKLVAADFEALG